MTRLPITLNLTRTNNPVIDAEQQATENFWIYEIHLDQFHNTSKFQLTIWVGGNFKSIEYQNTVVQVEIVVSIFPSSNDKITKNPQQDI